MDFLNNYRLQFLDFCPRGCPLKKGNHYYKEVSSWQLKLVTVSRHQLKEILEMNTEELWLQPPLEAMVLILLMAQSTGASSFLPSLSVCRGNAIVKFCFDISTEFIHAINLFLGDCMDQM
jgi:hypothetical protein